MSIEPKPADSLRQLKELVLGDEQRALEELSARLSGMEADSVDRLARDLAAALRRRRDGDEANYQELVAALQAGTESAIQRSVAEDKSRLAKALFPIMGPAIRSYVVDLFRAMAEELNETIRNTTSAERIKWRVQARLAGKSYSEYVLLKTRSFHIGEVYLIQKETGLLMLHAEAEQSKAAEGDADVVSGMFTAIRGFVRDSFGAGASRSDDDGELDGFKFGDREVLIEEGPGMVLAAVAHGVPPPSVREKLREILEDLHAELGGRLERFDGDSRRLETSLPTLRLALLKNQATVQETSDGGMWRLWVVIGVLAAGLGTWWFLGSREQSRWNRFETALRAEPGVAVTGVIEDGWWRKRRVTGLRDPQVDPSALAERMGIDLKKTTFEFGLMASLDPEFVAKWESQLEARQRAMLASVETLKKDLETTASRDGLEGLGRRVEETLASLKVTETAAEESRRRLLETFVKSQFADVPGLTVAVENGSTIRFSGAVSARDHASVLARAKPLESLATVDVTAVENGTARRLAELELTISQVVLRYADGTLTSDDAQTVAQVADAVRELDALAHETGAQYRFVVEAHPLIGANRAGNRPIERTRANRVKELLVGGGISGDRIETRLSEAEEKAGQGVSIFPLRNGAP
jgi:hypothetical protein